MECRDRSYLLTWNGTFVAYDRLSRRFLHCPLEGLGEARSAVTVVRREDRVVLEATDDVYPLSAVSKGHSHLSPVPSEQGQEFEVRNGATTPRQHLFSQGLYLCAEPSGYLRLSRSAASLWESFLLLPATDFADMRQLMCESWFAGRDGAMRERGEPSPLHRMTLRPSFRIAFGGVEGELNDNLAIWRGRRAGTSLRPPPPLRVPLLLGWRLQDAYFHRPLVYYAVSGERHLHMLALSLSSLFEVGAYTGDVLILSDQPDEQVRAFIPEAYRPKVYVQTLLTANVKSLRYQVGEWAWASLYQPLFYVDSDILFDRPVEAMLQDFTTSGLISVAPEPFSPFQANPAVGMHMFRAESRIPAGQGFNSGSFAIPNLADWEPVLKLILDVIRNGAKDARLRCAWYDQPSFNYVLMKLNCYDRGPLASRIRFDTGEKKLSPNEALGLVHFFCGEKDKNMPSYLAETRRMIEAPDLQPGMVHTSERTVSREPDIALSAPREAATESGI